MVEYPFSAAAMLRCSIIPTIPHPFSTSLLEPNADRSVCSKNPVEAFVLHYFLNTGFVCTHISASSRPVHSLISNNLIGCIQNQTYQLMLMLPCTAGNTFPYGNMLPRPCHLRILRSPLHRPLPRPSRPPWGSLQALRCF